MVEKRNHSFQNSPPGFESSVNSYGRKTNLNLVQKMELFESSVNSYGRKTSCKGL